MFSAFAYILMMLLNGVIALYDFSFYRIPNMLVLLVILAFFCAAPFMLDLKAILFSAGIFGVTLALGFLLFSFGIFGGGDAKYFAACSMWAGIDYLIPFLFIVSVVGGILSLGYMFGENKISIYSTNLWNQILLLEKRYVQLQCVWAFSGNGPEKQKRKAVKKNQIPYGVAISSGMIAVLYMKLIT